MGVSSSRASLVGAMIVGAVLVAGIGVVAVTVGPAIWAAATAQVAEEDTTLVLDVAGASATVPVDEGWVFSRALFDDSQATLRSPDGALTVRVRLTAGESPEDAARAQVDEDVPAFDSEPVGAVTVLHARTSDAQAIVGAVAEGDAVLAFTSDAPASYDAELAALLSRIVVTS